MSRLDDLHTLVRLLQEFELPVSPILEYSIREKEEELMQTTADEHTPTSTEQDKPIVTSSTEDKQKGESEIVRADFSNENVIQRNRVTDSRVEVIEHASLNMDKTLGITHAEDEEDGLSRLLQSLSSMNVSKIKGPKSPHKAIYIMTIMEGVSEGVLNPNKICIDTYLIQTYMKLWEKYVPKECPYAMDLCNPYMYLSSDPFYFLHFTVKPEPKIKGSWGISSIKSICDYAYISDEFSTLLRSVANRIKIKTFLINQFNLVGSQTSSILPSPMVGERDVENDKTIIPSLPKPQIRNQYGSAYFRISYPSGIVVESDSYNDVYVQFIKYANPQRVRSLNIRSLGANIIATKEEINKKYEKGYKYVGDGYYFNTISTTQRKYEVMTYLSNALRLSVMVELLPK